MSAEKDREPVSAVSSQATVPAGATDKARNAALSGVVKIQEVRKDYGLLPTCTGVARIQEARCPARREMLPIPAV